MNNNNPEILAPAGDFNTAIHALKNGADAVYLGMSKFSARKSASNFTVKELRHLKTFTKENNKKFYVAINTLIQNNEIPELIKLIIDLEDIGIDGLIVQDLGVAHLVKLYTNLELHASTQLAVHNEHGVLALIDLGFTRVVLSRELTFSEIKYLREKFPEMEFEIFIHGALCYGFSGLCLASSKLLDRSANRGECGQICRSWFNSGDSKGYYFSLNDVNMDSNILKLKEIGIDSLKIEGRMKSPSYAATASKLYYNILNGLDYSQELISTKTEFSRSGGTGYLNSKISGSTINKEYPGHIGILVGEVVSNSKNKIKIKTNKSTSIENRDGLLILTNDIPSVPIKFTTSIINKENNIITLNADIPKNIKNEVYKISAHDKELKKIVYNQYKSYKTIKKLELTINYKTIDLAIDNYRYSYDLIIQESIQKKDIDELIDKIFYHGGETDYSFESIIVNKTNFEYPFIPSSALKTIRNQFISDFLLDIEKAKARKTNGILNQETSKIDIVKYKNNKENIPFVTDFKDVNISNLISNNGYTLLPLSPICFDSNKYLNELILFLEQNKNINFIVGLNNISHLKFIHYLPIDIKYYCDYGLYCCNDFSVDFFNKNIRNLQWVTSWVEDKDNTEYPPVFISRTCFKSKEDGCPSNCKKEFSYNISQQNKKYKIFVKDCITYTVADF